jgi:hypothetical protein
VIKYILKLIVLTILLIFINYNKPFLFAQEFSDINLRPFVQLWQSGYTDSICRLLPQLKLKFSNAPEVQFFSRALSADGSDAYKFYNYYYVYYSSNVFADESLFRIIQYEVSLGLYEKAKKSAAFLKTEYPKSQFSEQSVSLFPELDNTSLIQDSVISIADNHNPVFTIQVGAFSELKNAEQMKKKLANSGNREIEIKIRTEKNKTLYLVLVGSFFSKEEAVKSAKKMNLPYTITFK